VEVTGAADVAAGEAEVDAFGVWETTGVAEEAVGAAGAGEADAWETAGTLAEGGARAGEGARTGEVAVAAGEGVDAGGTLERETAGAADVEVGAADPVGRVVVVVVVVGLIPVEVAGFAGPGASLDMWTTAEALMSPETIAFLRIVNHHLNGHDTFRAYLTSRLDCGRFRVIFLLLLDRSKSPRLEFGVSYSSCRSVFFQARIIFDQLIGIQGQQGRPLTFNNRTSKGLL
jgi:hypothetical protein